MQSHPNTMMQLLEGFLLPQLERVQHNQQTLLQLAARSISATNPSQSIFYAQYAAEFAWWNHTGLFSLPALENAVQRFAIKPKGTYKPRPIQKVLHVMTRAYEVGGHTRLVWRWIQLDSAREHALVLTNQGFVPIPKSLEGRTIHRLSPKQPLHAAQQLADLAQGFDLVVLHIHPSDALPILAFTHGSPPIALLNHADHVFWLGASVADMVINIRASGQDITVGRRGFMAQNALLPLPLPATKSLGLTRAAAKAQLGFDANTMLLFSAANAYKFAPMGGVHLLDLLEPVLQNPKVHLLVVGPSQEGRWQQAKEQYGTRVQAIGRQTSLEVYHAAADIYLDSFPMASLTSLLEAASRGVPCLAWRPPAWNIGVVSSDDPSLPLEVWTPTPEAYQARLEQLIDNPILRHKFGAKLAEAVLYTHTLTWRDQLEAVYQQILVLPPRLTLQEHPFTLGAMDGFLSQLHEKKAINIALQSAMAMHLYRLPLQQALEVWQQSARTGVNPRLWHFLFQGVLW